MQTILCNSDFINKIHDFDTGYAYKECLRFVKFKDSSPFTLDDKDYFKIIDSKCLFARKFRSETQQQKVLVEKIYSMFK